MPSHYTYLLLITLLLCLCCTTQVMGETADVLSFYDIYLDVNGAAIFFDDEYMGQISNGMLTVRVVSPDKRPYYQVSAINNGYRTITEDLPEIAGDMQHRSVFLSLSPLISKNGKLSVSSSPSQAKLFIDEKEHGITPQTITGLEPGTYRIKLIFQGYETWSTNAVVSGNATCNIYACLEKKYKSGILSVNSNPDGADIYLDKWKYGITPMRTGGISTGSHLIEIKKEGYIDLAKSVNVTEGIVTPVTFSLISIEEHNLQEEEKLRKEQMNRTGTLSFISSPSGAIIFIDSISQGATPNTVTDLTPGAHQVELMYEGYQEYQGSVVLSRGEKRSFNITMQRLPDPKFAPASVFPAIFSLLVAALFVTHKWYRKM
ncbi:PEGA domain-containing protein [Methanogenium marinum]|uniref:PEGA domain-containing protein n=1 Tax=Methanogenium marinum TaxID=348610 RepID=A0A9Q4KTU9_9EURY|nr:PEGA domain-containing protein [Methanogenium marinum]MDE4908701.1 PEGA domain-containing protein [Methanogenium marinum]